MACLYLKTALPVLQQMPAPAADMTHIDLSLAINYLPAVACLVKTLLISSTLVIVKPEHALGGFTLFALMLNFDRVFSGDRIFNVNAVLCMILFSWFINYLRMGMQSSGGVTAIIFLWWSLVSLCLLLEPTRLKVMVGLDGWGETTRVDPSPSRWNLRRMLPMLLNTLCIGMIGFTYAAEETGSFKIARSLAFAVLCIIWVYVVGVWQRCGQAQQAVFTQNLLARFCPMLFGPPLMSVGYVFVCMVALVYLYVELHGGGFKSWSRPQDIPEASPILEKPRHEDKEFKEFKEFKALGDIAEESEYWEAGQHSSIPDPEPDEDLEACFRAACSARGQ